MHLEPAPITALFFVVPSQPHPGDRRRDRHPQLGAAARTPQVARPRQICSWCAWARSVGRLFPLWPFSSLCLLLCPLFRLQGAKTPCSFFNTWPMMSTRRPSQSLTPQSWSTCPRKSFMVRRSLPTSMPVNRLKRDRTRSTKPLGSDTTASRRWLPLSNPWWRTPSTNSTRRTPTRAANSSGATPKCWCWLQH